MKTVFVTRLVTLRSSTVGGGRGGRTRTATFRSAASSCGWTQAAHLGEHINPVLTRKVDSPAVTRAETLRASNEDRHIITDAPNLM
jgi:hypothetical protein